VGELVVSFRDASGTAGTVYVTNGDTTGPHGFSVYAICLPSGG
jgi:hypothetical protein